MKTTVPNQYKAAGMVPVSDMRLTPAHFRMLAICSMEQVIGTAMSALTGIVLPMILILDHHSMSSFIQGLVGASGLLGIASGSLTLGKISDVKGYARLFRLCPLLITAGSVMPFIYPHTAMLVIGLFIVGFGVGGGYSLDSDYISELMPRKWSLFMVGVAKSTCSLGFIGISLCSYFIIKAHMEPEIWRWLMLLLTGLGVLTFMCRLRYPDSPKWLMDHGRDAEAQKAARFFFGPKAEVLPSETKKAAGPSASWADMFRDGNWKKVVFSGIPWACEGVGVYGIGVFLPVLVMALGIDSTNATGMSGILNSVELSTVINCFILPGFALGLLIVRRAYHVGMLTWGFLFYSIGVGLVMAAYLLKWPVWISIIGFLMFEIALNAGPHLVTFIIPSQIYSVDERGAGSGLAAMIGKLGAILGVFLMPIVLDYGGMTAVLIFCISVGVLGMIVSAIFGRIVLPRSQQKL